MYVCAMNRNINKYNMTVAGVVLKASPRRSEEFSINRPFLYAIVAQRGDKIVNSNPLTLFIGRIFTPESPK